MKKLLQLFLLLFICNSIFAQTIKGTITDSLGNKVNFAQVLVQKEGSTVIEQFVLANEEKFELTLNKPLEKGVVIVQALGFARKKIPLNFTQKSVFELQVQLTPVDEKIKAVVVSRKKQVYEQNDTTIYEVERFLDGTERKVEDVLKNMPGINVNATTGEIKYMGKLVETVMLEGDNLFDKQYTLGTKNINVDAVEKVEAIKNYTENKLLKGIEGGDKVALNLKIKQGVFDLSGSADVGSGFVGENVGRYVNGNILAIRKKIKAFSVVSHNNYGKAKTPFDYFGRSQNVDEVQNEQYIAQNAIAETSWQGLTNQEDSRFNNEYFGNINAILKWHKNSSIKTNLYYIYDELNANRFVQNKYIIDDILTTDLYNITKQPTQYRGDVEVKWDTGKHSNIKLNSRLSQEEITTNRNNLQNNVVELNSILQTQTNSNINRVEYTKKIDNHDALVVSATYSNSKRPQQYSIQKEGTNQLQYSEYQKQVIQPEVNYLLARKKLKAEAFTKLNAQEIHLNSEHTNKNINKLEYQNNQILVGAKAEYRFGKFKAEPKIAYVHSHQNLDNAYVVSNNSSQNNYISPYFSLLYDISDKTKLRASIVQNQDVFSEQYIYTSPIMVNERTFVQNDVSFQLQKTNVQKLSFFFKDWYKQFNVVASATRSINNGSYLAKQVVTPTELLTTNQYIPNETKRLSANVIISKYMAGVESTIKLFGTVSNAEYYNIINTSTLRKNEANVQSANLFYKTAFDGKVNFENVFNINTIASKTESIKDVYRNQALSNRFKVISYLQDDLLFFNGYTYYKPNASTSQVYHFVHSTLRYKPEQKDWSFDILFDNILNEKENKNRQTTDYSETVQTYQILPRRLRTTVSYSF